MSSCRVHSSSLKTPRYCTLDAILRKATVAVVARLLFPNGNLGTGVEAVATARAGLLTDADDEPQ